MEPQFREILKHELLCEASCVDVPKDILIVVKDGLSYLRTCINSLYRYTKNFNLYLWDNASEKPTASYLQRLKEKRKNVVLFRSEDNLGFILPNNRMAEQSRSPYLICLNSDTRVRQGWDLAMLGYLQGHPKTGLVGYMGGVLSNDGWCESQAFGSNIDYVMGWCFAIHSDIYQQFGLFDENYRFAYFEDSDLCLRILERGYLVHALSLRYVDHVGNATVQQISNADEVRDAIQCNRKVFLSRWQAFLTNRSEKN